MTDGVAGIPTAILGEAGSGGPVIAILGEYDALPGLSQVPGIAKHTEVEPGGHGHGCGHNLLGSASLLAATAVKEWIEERGIDARIRYYGCPAEEGGAAKTYMVREGLFDDVDAAISWHPASFTGVSHSNSLANCRIDFMPNWMASIRGLRSSSNLPRKSARNVSTRTVSWAGLRCSTATRGEYRPYSSSKSRAFSG